jgi:hypothetical protein
LEVREVLDKADIMRELDAKIAELRGEKGWYRLGSPAIGSMTEQRPFHYSTDIRAAMELWDEMVGRGLAVTVEGDGIEFAWVCQIWELVQGKERKLLVETIDKTAPSVLCNAYLEWRGEG